MASLGGVLTDIRHKLIFSHSHSEVENVLKDVFDFLLSFALGDSLRYSSAVSSVSYKHTAVEWSKAKRTLLCEFYVSEMIFSVFPCTFNALSMNAFIKSCHLIAHCRFKSPLCSTTKCW
jgi:hypothetical protein